MRLRNINSLLAIVFAALMITSSAVFASTWPVVKNPAHSWPPGTTWGTNIRVTDGTYTGEAWFGEGTSGALIGAPPDPPDGVIIEFLYPTSANKVNTWVSPPVNTDNSIPARLRAVGAGGSTVTITSKMFNLAPDNLYVPEDFSATLENASNSIKVINLRAASTVVSGLPLFYTLVLDNAVNITSVTTTDPLSGNPGDNLNLQVTVVNTGHLTDNYALTANAGTVMTGALAPSGSITENVPAVYPNGTQTVNVDAVGIYASDEENSLALSGIPVTVSITPSPDYGWTGDTVIENVTVTNLEAVGDTFNITLSDSWGASWVVAPGSPQAIAASGTWTGQITTVVAGSPGNIDSISVTATSTTDGSITATKVKALHNNLASLTEFITPASQSQQTPGSYTFTVHITNTGALADNFTLVVADDQGWSPVLNENVVEIPAGATDISAIVTVTMPNAVSGTVDTITVTENSVHQPSVGVDSIATLTKLSSLAGVTISISTPEGTTAHVTAVDYLINPAWSYDPLTFDVKVMNNGNLDDKYVLTAQWMDANLQADNTMGLKLTPDELFIPAHDNEYAALSVTLPSDWLGGVSGTILITAVGQLSRENQVNLYPTGENTITVTSGIENSVQKEIMPDTAEPQTAAPGSPLVWLVVLKNTGNIVENLSMSLTEALSGVSSASAPRTSWGAAFDNVNFLNVPAGTKVTTYLRVTAPSDAKTSEWDNITITVIDNMGASDIEMVRAHVVQPGPRIPEGQIEISVEAQILAIEVWPQNFNFGVLDEEKIRNTTDNFGVTFTVRNTGNVAENILVKGTNAQSMPGEPVATWTLSDVSIGLDQYMLKITPIGTFLSTTNKLIWGGVAPGTEQTFGLTIYTPSSISTPARMWARIKLTAIAAVPPV